METPDDFISGADMALYQAKQPECLSCGKTGLGYDR